MASSHVSPQSHQRLFAIVVDPAVSENCGASIDAYARSIRADGLETLIIVDKWHVPDSIGFNCNNYISTITWKGPYSLATFLYR